MLFSPMILSLALASGDSFAQKDSYVKLASELKLGVFLSDLPVNHDLYQLLTVWKYKYANLPILGSAIISPLVYVPEIFLKQVKTLFEIFDSGIELGLGLGDKNLLKRKVENRMVNFQSSVNQLLNDPIITKSNNVISIAGSGKKLLTFANDNDLGIIYNGIIDKEVITSIESRKSKSNLSTYVMTDINPYESLSKGFIRIVSRIITGLSSKEIQRLQIDQNVVENVKIELRQNNLINYKKWLPEETISKIAVFGSKEEIIEKLHQFNNLNVKQIILSITGATQKLEFIEFLRHNRIVF